MSEPRAAWDGCKLWVAQGLGAGRAPVAPGTFGTVLGLVWTSLLLLAPGVSAYVAGCVAGFLVSVWLCGDAERQLRATDPGSVVIDEITALPLCFAPWVFLHSTAGPTEALAWSWGGHWHGLFPVAGFLVFRLFDIWKPWPVRQSQHLPGGWGVTVDDFLAAGYTAVVLELADRLLPQR